MQSGGSREMQTRPIEEDSGTAGLKTLGYSDLPSVISIERRSFPTPWSLAMFVLELSKPSSICLAAHDPNGEIHGYLICARYDKVWHLMNVAVAPEMRRRGVAAALIREMFERSGSGARFTLEVRESNQPAIAMYERLGFQRAGRRQRYYQDNGEDALIMWCSPTAPPAETD